MRPEQGPFIEQMLFWTAPEPTFKPDWQSLHAHRDPEWFRDAKFGIYTHWGPVTVGCEDAPQGGEWYGREMYLNGEAIYGTRPWLVYGEGPTRSGGGGFSEGHDQAFSARDIRFTTKGDALYALTLGWGDRLGLRRPARKARFALASS